jgi:serine/threonine protein kinase
LLPPPPNNLSELAPFLSPAADAGELGRLGHVPILDFLGAGGMGFVCKAKQPLLGRVVALKAMKPDYAGDAVLRKMFQREAQAMAAVEHERVVIIHEVGKLYLGPGNGLPELLYFFMPLLTGRTLLSRLNQPQALPVEAVLRLALEMAGACRRFTPAAWSTATSSRRTSGSVSPAMPSRSWISAWRASPTTHTTPTCFGPRLARRPTWPRSSSRGAWSTDGATCSAWAACCTSRVPAGRPSKTPADPRSRRPPAKSTRACQGSCPT